MSDQLEKEVETVKVDLAEMSADGISQLPFRFFDRPSNRTTKLLATSDDGAPMDGRHQWYNYKFVNPAIVTEVQIDAQGYSSVKDFEFKWVNENGSEITGLAEADGATWSFEINGICRKLSFRPPLALFSDTAILEVRVLGVEPKNIRNSLKNLNAIEAYKDQCFGEIADRLATAHDKEEAAKIADSERAAILREINQLKSTVSRNKKTVDQLALKKNELITESSAVEDAIKLSKDRLDRIDADVHAKQQDYRQLSEQTSNLEKTLKSLRDNINLFPSEISEFVNQGSKNINQYWKIILVPILLIFVMFFLLVKGSADLSVIISNDPTINIEAVLLSRVPYVAIAIAIITACYKIARVFISEMIKINNQRLSLTKISIIAKDISSSSEHDLNLQDEEIYRLRAALKMHLLRDHLKDYLSKEFEIELPRRILGTFPIGKERVSAQLADSSSSPD